MEGPKPMKLSPHFALSEFTVSQHVRSGVSNDPGPKEKENLQALAELLEQVRELCGNKPVLISSGYRSPAINRLVGGSANSQHMLGLAADFTIPGFGTPFDVCKRIIESGIAFDQLIYEYGSWVHLSATPRPRRSILSKFTGTPYLVGLRKSATSPALDIESHTK